MRTVDWRRVAIILIAVGGVIIIAALIDGREVVVEHQTLTFDDGYVEMGPYLDGRHRWSIWVEDYYKGFEGEGFRAYVTAEPNGTPIYMSLPRTDLLREYDDVECLLEHSWEPFAHPKREVYHVVDAGPPIWSEEDTAEVYLVRTAGTFHTLVLMAAFVVLTVGLVILVWKWRPKEK